MAQNKKIAWSSKIVTWAYPKMEKLAPRWAHGWAIDKFFTPVKFPSRPEEGQMLATANTTNLKVEGQDLQLYSWGKAGPTIILFHGWSGRSGQFRLFVPELLRAGFRVVAFDAPAHGKSTGEKTDLLEFSSALQHVVDHVGQVEGIIAHSMGGAATIHAMVQGLRVPNVVFISIPTQPDLIMQGFQSRLNASDSLVQDLHQYIDKKYQLEFDSLFAPTLAPQMPEIHALIVHDQKDLEVPFEHAETLEELLPDARKVATEELGHTRILRDAGVINESVEFLKEAILNPVQ